MRIATLLIAPIAVCTLLAAACSGSASSQPTSTPEPKAKWAVQTGIAPVDGFLNLIAAGDFAKIALEAAYAPIECTSDPLIADHPLRCAEGEPDGSVTYGIGVGCLPAVSIYTQDELMDRIDDLGEDGLELEAVYWADSGHSAYAVAFTERGAPPAPAIIRITVFLTDDGRLESYASCGEFSPIREDAMRLWP
jgi:hypothetical protein